jgi:hypothetical protein
MTPNLERPMDADERDMQLYILEYQKAAERYENIYRSIWTIFSYLTAVTAGFLAFGSDRIEPHALVAIAAIPLLFWFWTTYLPLDRYGNGTAKRLRDLERLLNDRFKTKLNHFSGFWHPPSVICGIVKAIKTRPARALICALWDQVRRARFAIWLFFILLHVVFLCGLWKWHKSCQPLFREKPAVPTTVIQSQ